MAITARGVIARTPGAPAEVEEFTIDDPGPNEVLVRILASGVCHTDLGVKTGVYGTDGFPFLLGHEGAGIIEVVGPGVTSPQVGDHVIIAWRAPCGTCRFCRAGQPNYCANSLNAEKRMRDKDGTLLNPVLGIGTFCTHTLVHAKQAIPIAHDLPSAQMSLIGCGVMTGVGAALYQGKVTPGSSVAVFGCGGVGDSVIAGARLAGATTIIAVDIDPRKLEWAKEFGATHTVNSREEEPVVKIKELTGGNGVNFSFEAVGRAETLEQAIFCRDLAGTCIFIGVPGPGKNLNLDLQRFFDVGGYVGVSWYGNCLPTRDFPLLADWYKQGQLNLDKIVTRTIALEETEEAFAAMERGETLRSVIVFDA
ncbi:MAG: Formaldehyde dehydrogenase MscR, NAD/mycothiol-dependent / S-nitrosomycothiol reductase MscR [uncultured Thermomicrobiales bacterium]|uniref:Formaldehyde dehydrogenase MscR, NAD/mycothiol-dependent / S-nitrosomycothiol reductase MscR n=1 Tax=uncultured Thermomicrobiales bacterium TaxID=1645740 RepID=A0A6J4UVU0_9BACT|nr:MAG: Formaldehyde dehydrogenase MscR, NAD/mycothiol-dependent / S-nitrosomycothiol reductase MscR [uncultured Thermomicrobiales bacterium]